MHLKRILTTSLSLAMMGSTACFSEFIGPPAGAAGVVEKEIQKEYSVGDLSPEKQIPLLEVDLPETQLDLPEGISVRIDHIQLEGNYSLPPKELYALILPYLGKDLTGKEVKELCLSLQNLYVKRGFILARVYPPVQEIHDQSLTLQVVEGILGSIEIQGNHFYKKKYIHKYFAHLEKRPVNYHEMMRALLLVNENSDLGVGAIFKKGKEFGEVDLALIVKDQLPFHVYGDYNTWGSNVTTYGRAGSKLSGGNLATNGDTLSLVGVVGIPPKDLYYINTTYSAPINTNGMFFDLSYLYSHFEVQQMKQLNLEGISQIAGGKIRQALNRSKRFSTDVFLSFDYKQLKNEVLNGTGSFDRLRDLGFGGKIDYTDSFKGRNLFNVSWTFGIPYFLGGLKPVDPQCSRQGAGGRYFIVNLEYTRLQTLPWESFLYLSGSAQGTFNKLPLPEQIYIGGMGTVRGYPLSVALGDVGYYGTIEFHAPIPGLVHKQWRWLKKPWRDIFQLVGFIDHGGVYTNASVPSEISPTYLTSVGAGVRCYGPWNLSVSFDAGFPLTVQEKLFNSILYLKVSMGI